MKKLQIVTGPNLPTAQTEGQREVCGGDRGKKRCGSKTHKFFMNILVRFSALYLFMIDV